MRILTLVLALWLPLVSAFALGHSHGCLHSSDHAPVIAAPHASPCDSGTGSSDALAGCPFCASMAGHNTYIGCPSAELTVDDSPLLLVSLETDSPRSVTLIAPTGRGPPL